MVRVAGRRSIGDVQLLGRRYHTDVLVPILRHTLACVGWLSVIEQGYLPANTK